MRFWLILLVSVCGLATCSSIQKSETQLTASVAKLVVQMVDQVLWTNFALEEFFFFLSCNKRQIKGACLQPAESLYYFTNCLLQVKVLTNPGSNVPLATPVAISTTLPPMVSALSQQGSNSALPAPSSHRTNTSLAPAPSSGVQSPAIQLFLSQLSAYVKGTPSFSSFSVTLCACLACLLHTFRPAWLDGCHGGPSIRHNSHFLPFVS